MKRLNLIFQNQKAYNEKVRAKEGIQSHEHWMKQYLLGAVSEVNEILDEINWKVHKRGHPVNPYNLARELADLTKYVLSMWEVSGFDADAMLNFVAEKGDELDAQWVQDWLYKIPPASKIILTDLDGTLGNWRKAFMDWLMTTHGEDLPLDSGINLAMEVEMKIPYPKYASWKKQFEAEGGYRILPVYPDVQPTFQALDKAGVIGIAYTARPAKVHGRIWSDTWEWLENNQLHHLVKELRIGAEDRISRACELKEQGHQVLMLEDDPGLAIRAATSGIPVLLRSQPYNKGINHINIYRTDTFAPAPILKLLKRSV